MTVLAQLLDEDQAARLARLQLELATRTASCRAEHERRLSRMRAGAAGARCCVRQPG